MHPILSGDKGMKAALGKIPSGLFVVGAVDKGERIGMLCSFVEQAGFKPPMVSLALGVDRLLNQLLQEGGLFSLNILGKEDSKLLSTFASGRGQDPFGSFPLIENSHNLPQLAGALAWMACRPCGSVAAGDHVVHVAEVLQGCLHREGSEPMIRLRKNGLSY